MSYTHVILFVTRGVGGDVGGKPEASAPARKNIPEPVTDVVHQRDDDVV